MTDLTQTIAPKSDQLNSDDLIGRDMTIRITGLKLCAEPDQPIAINFDGDNGKPYKPCKSMRRVFVNVWGGDGNAYIGRRVTLFRDEKVQFGGMAVGGIRISHMSDITAPVTMALTATRANRKPYTVKPLAAETRPSTMAPAPSQDLIDAARSAAMDGTEAYKAYFSDLSGADRKALTDHGYHDTNKTAAAMVGAPKNTGTATTDPIANAIDRGKAAFRNGQNARAMPAEYRADDRTDEADAWLEGLEIARTEGAGQ